MADAYCMKCKQKTAVVNAKIVPTRNGGTRVTGTCADCGTKVSAIVSKNFKL